MADSAESRDLPQQTRRNILETMEIDTRLLGMIGAFVVICVVFDVWTGGRFLPPPPAIFSI